MLALLPEPERALYQRYAKGEKTPETRAAKRLYMAVRRDAARAQRVAFELANPGQRYIVHGIVHGIGGYTNHSCRCRSCTISHKVAR